ncbi:MAG: EAL domain-containing protein, partial [Clostridium sp.]
MNFLKKINMRLTSIITIFIITILILNMKILSNGFNKSMEYIFESQYSEIKYEVSKTLKLLKIITDKISCNDEIIEILEANRNAIEQESSDSKLIQNQVDTFQGVLETLTFVDTINIINIPGKYLVSNGAIYENFDVSERPWYNLGVTDDKQETFISDIHKHYTTGRYEMSIISYIHSSEDNSILGLAVLDIFIDDLIKSINSDFYLGSLETYIEVEEGIFYGEDNIIMDDEEDSEQYYIKESNNIFKPGLNTIFRFDEKSLIYSKELKSYNFIQVITYSLFGIILTLILFKTLTATFNPVIRSLDRLKKLIKTSENVEIDFENLDEIEQLESISNILSKSFDNKMEFLIYYDELTKLPNRKMLNKKVKELKTINKEFALIFLDLNKFKQVNDLFGHLTGDELLKCFSNKVKSVIKDDDMIIRYSGDEFIILYTDYKSEKELINFYEDKILEEFKRPVLINNKNILISFSAGVAVYPRDGEVLDELINKSDFMMYENKNNLSKSELLFFNDDIYNRIIKIETIKSELKKSVIKNEFILHYQPIVDKNKIVRKVEVLVRWQNEKLGFVSPLNFISYAEETGDIIPIGYWIIENVCKKYKYLSSGYEHELQISINVSPIQLMEVRFIDNVTKIINRYNIEPQYICFEITESVVLDGNIVISNNIKRLCELGVKIALDDFGTGYSSFSYLKKFNLDILKIDKIFIDDADKVDYKIVNNIRSIANHLSMETVCEGVETLEQF